MRYLLLLTFVSIQAAALECPHDLATSFDHLKAKYPAIIGATPEALAAATGLAFGDAGFGDADLPYLCALPNLESLSIYNDHSAPDRPDKLTGVNLEYLTLLPKLGYLDLDGNRITGAELWRLKGMPSLSALKIGMGNPIGGEGLESLDEIAPLKRLVLQAIAMKPEDLAWLARSGKVYDSIYIGDNGELGNAALVYLGQGKARTYLGLDKIGLKSADGFEYLAANPYLQIFELPPFEAATGLAVMEKMKASTSLLEVGIPMRSDLLEVALQISALRKVTTFVWDGLDGAYEFLAKALGRVSEVELTVLSIEEDPKPLCAKLKAEFPDKKIAIRVYRKTICE